uniref:Recep_L_domain domain-containing protein n=1 Tax=Rhabditophanes sp. KR3021 TaxID=114890 RepID=A0AC35TU68_9BILA
MSLIAHGYPELMALSLIDNNEELRTIYSHNYYFIGIPNLEHLSIPFNEQLPSTLRRLGYFVDEEIEIIGVKEFNGLLVMINLMSLIAHGYPELMALSLIDNNKELRTIYSHNYYFIGIPNLEHLSIPFNKQLPSTLQRLGYFVDEEIEIIGVKEFNGLLVMISQIN